MGAHLTRIFRAFMSNLLVAEDQTDVCLNLPVLVLPMNMTSFWTFTARLTNLSVHFGHSLNYLIVTLAPFTGLIAVIYALSYEH